MWALGLAQHRWSFWSGASVEISQLLVPLAEKSFIVHGGSVCALSCFSRVLLCATPWTVAHLVSLSVGFSKQEYWSGLPCTPSGDLPKPGIALESLMSPALASGFFTTRATWEALMVEELETRCHFFFSLLSSKASIVGKSGQFHTAVLLAFPKGGDCS